MTHAHIDSELEQLRVKLMEMWDLVEYQLYSGREAMVNADQNLARKVIKLGKKVNNFDVKIDRMCENMLALYTPVAVDLRVVLASLKINANLERIGDTAEGISMYIQNLERPYNPEMLEITKAVTMFDEALAMFHDCRVAYKTDNTEMARALLKRDKMLNKIYRKSENVIAQYLRSNTDSIDEGLALLAIIKKLERVGDQITNIAEEIIFYQDAKVVKHKTKKKDKENGKNGGENQEQ
ncbi:phosphate signaling complex protein PhoU [Pontibacter sp. KCTC 32443]|uniref:phosphate signaling complex protein PhoU n=1 Tax=Pontibacter TaxID=323449 RepID=UPI00164CE2C0|nr:MULTISPECIES: phosphate signaling complex protein PhoU [Pontibacter]MBC5774214.1 phosphate signaling complex protein PhoU [Pontibacter sp. KCTC 32443]